MLNAIWHLNVKKTTGIKSSRQKMRAKLHTAVETCRLHVIQYRAKLYICNTAIYDVLTSCMTIWADVAPQSKV